MDKRRSPLVWIPPLQGGDFQGMGSIVRWPFPLNAQRETLPQLPLHLSGNQMSLVPELLSTRIRNTFQRWSSGAIPIGRKHWFPNHKHSHRFGLSFLQNAFDCRGPLQTFWSSWGQKQHNACVRKGGVEVLLKLRNIAFIQRDERWLARRSGTRSPKVKPDRENRNCKYQPERSFSCHQFLSCKPVSNELREYGDQDHHNYCDPKQRHADATTLGAALLASAINLTEADDKQQDGGAEQPRPQGCDPDTGARQPESTDNSERQAARQSR